MLNLHAWNVYMGILCVLLKIDEEWYYCCWIVDEFMVNCCCCYEMYCWWIDAMCNTPIFNISLLILLLDNISINVIISIGC